MSEQPLDPGSPGPRFDPLPRGMALLRDPTLNKGNAFTEAERDAFGLRGLLPPHVLTQDERVARVLENLRRFGSPLSQDEIAVAVAEVAFAEGLAGIERPDDLLAFMQAQMYQPHYPRYLD